VGSAAGILGLGNAASPATLAHTCGCASAPKDHPKLLGAHISFTTSQATKRVTSAVMRLALLSSSSCSRPPTLITSLTPSRVSSASGTQLLNHPAAQQQPYNALVSECLLTEPCLGLVALHEAEMTSSQVRRLHSKYMYS
jgi:hypothetical protein